MNVEPPMNDNENDKNIVEEEEEKGSSTPPEHTRRLVLIKQDYVMIVFAHFPFQLFHQQNHRPFVG